LSQRALAEKAAVSPGYLNEIESGNRPGSLATMAKIARALDIPVDTLVRAHRATRKAAPASAAR
jgi:transcriptional regulator with XRE-family HTH domain